jgi:nucleoside-diphosphate-sugar epimerase
MKILITGGGGFLGQKVAHTLLARGDVSEIVLFDIAEPAQGIQDPRVRFVKGEVSDTAAINALIVNGGKPDIGGIFHLAAVVSGQAESDFELGMRVNLDGLRNVLEAARLAGNRPRLLFSSSIAVFGTPLPDVITDATTPTPQASYGVQKLIGEWLVADYHRKGFIDGRAVRIPTVSVRPGKANAAASSFASAVIREPLNGIDYGCPVPPETLMWMCGPRNVVSNLVRAFDLPSEAWGVLRAVSLPGIVVSVAEMVASLRKLGGDAAARRVTYIKDERIQAIVKTWAAKLETPRALAMGFTASGSMDQIVAEYIEDERIKV